MTTALPETRAAAGAPLGAACALLLGLALGDAGCRAVDEIDAPAVRLQDVQVRGLSGGVADVLLALEVHNTNDFDVRLVGLAGRLEIEGKAVGEVGWSGEFDCPKKRASVLRIPLRMAVGEQQRMFTALIDGSRPLRGALRGESTFANGVIRRTLPLAVEEEVGEWSCPPPPAAPPDSGTARPQERPQER